MGPHHREPLPLRGVADEETGDVVGWRQSDLGVAPARGQADSDSAEGAVGRLQHQQVHFLMILSYGKTDQLPVNS